MRHLVTMTAPQRDPDFLHVIEMETRCQKVTLDKNGPSVTKVVIPRDEIVQHFFNVMEADQKAKWFARLKSENIDPSKVNFKDSPEAEQLVQVCVIHSRQSKEAVYAHFFPSDKK